MSPLAYIPPGVTITELTTPSIAPLLAIPGSVCLVGVGSGAITRTDTIRLTGTTVTTLPGVPAGATMTSGSLISVIDALNPSVAPSGFISGTDFNFNAAAYTLARIVTSNTLASGASAGASTFTLSAGPVPAAGQVVRLTNGGVTETATVLSVSGQIVTLTSPLINTYVSTNPVTWGTIPDGDSIYVTYTYTPSDYFQPVRLNSVSDIETRFGPSWDPTTTFINSSLSFAASLAFQNGASNVVLQPLYQVNASTGVRQQPNATQIATASTWATVFNGLLSLDDVNILVPVIGQSATNVTDAIQVQILEAAQDYIYQSKHGNGSYQVAVLAEDSTASPTTEAQESTMLGHANTIATRYASDVTQQLVFINTAQFSLSNATSSFLVGGQYIAAAVAGMLSARSPASSLTRQAVSGVLSVTDQRTLAQKNNDAANGMLVIEAQGNVVQVRHGITMDTSSVAVRELNVVRSKHFIIESVSHTLDSQVIGQVVADSDAPTLVNNVVIATLEDLRGLGILTNYSGVQSRILSIDPTSMEVRFSYQPAFTVNYVSIVFALDLTNQSVSVSTASTG